MKRKLPRWFLAAAWAVSRRAPLLCWRRLFRCWRWPLSCWRRLALLAPAFFSCCGGAVVCCCAAAAAKIWPPKWPRTPHNPILARTSTLRRGMRFLGLFLKCYVRPKIAVQVFPVFWGGWVDRAPRERAQKFRESQKTGPRDHPYQGLTAYRSFLPYPTQEKSCSSLKMAFLASLGLLQPCTCNDVVM